MRERVRERERANKKPFSDVILQEDGKVGMGVAELFINVGGVGGVVRDDHQHRTPIHHREHRKRHIIVNQYDTRLAYGRHAMIRSFICVSSLIKWASLFFREGGGGTTLTPPSH